jgi:branched-chain amino acid transport system substrate-binding protein
MKNRIVPEKRLGIILAVALATLLLFTACTPAPMEKGNVLEIGYIGPLTGAGASSEQLVLFGYLDYVRYFNEQEIIPGVSIKVQWADSAMSVSNFLSKYEIFKARGIPVMMSNESVGLAAFHSKFEQDQIPLCTTAANQELVYPPEWCYFRSPTWAEHFAVLADYIMENWHEDRPPRLAFMALDTDFGRQPIIEGTKYAQSLGIEMLPVEFVPFVPLDTTPQLLRLKQEEADFAYISSIIVTSGPILRDAERLDLLGQIHFCGMEYSYGERLIQMAGAASEGYFTPNTMPSFAETEVPGVKLMLDNEMKYHGKVGKDPEAISGWTIAAIACEAIKRAVENVGYENVDGPAMKQAFDSMKDFDVYGLLKITYTPEDHRGSTKIAIYQIKDGKIVPATDWREAPMLVPQE